MQPSKEELTWHEKHIFFNDNCQICLHEKEVFDSIDRELSNLQLSVTSDKKRKFECQKHFFINSDSRCLDCRKEKKERKQRKQLRLRDKIIKLVDDESLSKSQLKQAIVDLFDK